MQIETLDLKDHRPTQSSVMEAVRHQRMLSWHSAWLTYSDNSIARAH